MSLVEPFYALYYNPQLVKNLNSLICPPYDIIDKKQDKYFKKLSPYNFCNILRTDSDRTYKDLAIEFNSWLKKGIFIESKELSFYLYEQKFIFGDKSYRRIGFLGLLRLDKKEIIFPHEHTFSGPRKDRFCVLKELKANLSPIFVIVPGKLDILSRTYMSYCHRLPFIDFCDYSHIQNRVWSIGNRDIIQKIKITFSRRKLFIADGHHRFEVGYQYFKKTAGVKGNNYILTYFTDSCSGLLVLPIHRVVKTDTSKKEFLKKSSRYFNIFRVNKDDFNLLLKGSRNKVTFGLCVNGYYYIIYLKKNSFWDIIFTTKEDSVYSKLEVYILHKLVLSNLRCLEITYTHSLEEAIKLSKKGKNGKFSFILRPTPLKSIFNIAQRGYRLPAKSTYFYPKLPCGIVARRF